MRLKKLLDIRSLIYEIKIQNDETLNQNDQIKSLNYDEKLKL